MLTVSCWLIARSRSRYNYNEANEAKRSNLFIIFPATVLLVPAARAKDATVALSIACIPILEKVTHCVWPIIWTSSLFFAFLIWDILGDVWDWSRSVWAPLLTLSVPAGVWVYSFARAHWCSARGHVVGRSASDANMISMGGMEKASSMKNEDHRIGAPVDSTSNPLQEGAENAAR